MTDQRQEKFNLYWVCEKTGTRYPAGVAFYNDDKSNYRLKIDAMPDEKPIYLRSVSVSEGIIKFRVEIAVRINNQIRRYAEIGGGQATADGGYPIVMHLGPFSKMLVLEPSA